MAQAVTHSRSSRARAVVRCVRSKPAVNRISTDLALRVSHASVRLATALERHGLRAGEIHTQLPNGREIVLCSDGRDALASRIWWRGWQSFDQTAASPWFWLASEARLVVDVGANIGLFSLLAGLANPESQCFAFEPVPLTRSALERNIHANPLARVTCVPVAVGSQAGTLNIYSDPSELNDSLASTRPVQDVRGRRVERYTVPVVTLDDWVRTTGVGRIDLAKIDVEGHEPDVLKGMEGILGTDRPEILVEVLNNRSAAAVSEVAARFGYRHHLLTSAGPIQTDDVVPHPSCLNHLLTTRDDRDLRTLWR